MQWFMALNECSDEGLRNHVGKYEDFAKVAVFSARLNAPRLKPNLIYNGGENDFTREMAALGVNVVFHKLSFEHLLDAVPGRDALWRQTARGAMLRMDLPTIVDSDETILYTDTDVVFQADPGQFAFPCDVLAVSSEFDIDNFDAINTGAMIINLANARQPFAELIRWTIPRLHLIPDYDQGAFRLFFDGKWARLDPRMNWKPYWGINPAALIVHYHGPKPHNFDARSCVPDFADGIYRHLYERSPSGYEHYIGLWYDYLERYRQLAHDRSDEHER